MEYMCGCQANFRSHAPALQESLESQEDFETFIKSTGLKGMQLSPLSVLLTSPCSD